MGRKQQDSAGRETLLGMIKGEQETSGFVSEAAICGMAESLSLPVIILTPIWSMTDLRP